MKSIKFASALFSAGVALDVQIAGRDDAELKAATVEVKDALAKFEGVSEITDSLFDGGEEIRVSLSEQGELLGLSTDKIGTQLRAAFFGQEVQRLQFSGNEVRVMLRYPRSFSSQISQVKALPVEAPGEVELGEVAKIERGRGYLSINAKIENGLPT